MIFLKHKTVRLYKKSLLLMFQDNADGSDFSNLRDVMELGCIKPKIKVFLKEIFSDSTRSKKSLILSSVDGSQTRI